MSRDPVLHRPSRGISFAEWLVFMESVDANMGAWIKAIVQHARPEEKRVIDAIIGSGLLRMAQGKDGEYELRQDYDASVKAVLKEKRKEDMNWLAFALGYLSVKAFRREDLEMAIDALEQMKASGKVTRAEIGRLGWMQLGASMQERMAEFNRNARQISKTKSRKMAEKGEIAPEDAHLIRHVAQEGELDLYYLPRLTKGDDVDGRHRLLCKYGKGTEWCTANPGGDYHRHYRGVGIFIVHSSGQPKYQFVDCGDVPEEEWPDEEQEEENNESIAQFMDVNDEPVTSLGPREQKFLKKHANIFCYGLAPDGFDDWEDFVSSSDERVRASSGEVVASVLAMAGERIGTAMRRLGPALSRMSRGNVYLVARSDAWGPRVADEVLDVLVSDFLGDIEKDKGLGYDNGVGTYLLMKMALMACSDPVSRVEKLADFVGPQEISEFFKTERGGAGDRFLMAILENRKKSLGDVTGSLVVYAKDAKKMLDAIGPKFSNVFYGANKSLEFIFESLKKRGDGSLAALSEFLEENIDDMPPGAVNWCILSSPEPEETAKRLLSRGLDDVRLRNLFRVPGIAHLADDSHIRKIASTRKKDSHFEKLADLASSHGEAKDAKGKAERMVRFLKNSDDLESDEILSAMKRANVEGFLGAMEEIIPQEIVDMVSLEDMKKMAKEADKSCNGWTVSPREGCSMGRPLVAVLKRTKLHFPMGMAVYMKAGKDRDDLIIKNLNGSSTRDVRHALDLVEDHDRFVQELVKVRGGDLSPGEVASVIGHSKDKKKALEMFKDKIDSLDGPYERYGEDDDERILSSDDNEDWMDSLMSFRGAGGMLDEILKIYKKPLRPKAIFHIIKSSEDKGSAIEKIGGHIKALDENSYTRLQSLMRAYSSDMNGKTLVLVDEVRNGGAIAEGETVVAFSAPWSRIVSVSENGRQWMVGRTMQPPESTNFGKSNQMDYKVVETGEDEMVVSPTGEFKARVEGYDVVVDEDWRLRVLKANFARVRRSMKETSAAGRHK